jgi:hypothetical protein
LLLLLQVKDGDEGEGSDVGDLEEYLKQLDDELDEDGGEGSDALLSEDAEEGEEEAK